jgi:hypothetical protein
VRDLLGGKSGKHIVDIDMTISQTYATLEFVLTDFFNSRGREVTERILLTETSKSRFGQMKVAKVLAGDQEDLDVACLKSRSFPENDPIRVNMVSTACAREGDGLPVRILVRVHARSHDYTFNRVYLEPFPNNATRLIDIYETGTQDGRQHLLRARCLQVPFRLVSTPSGAPLIIEYFTSTWGRGLTANAPAN